MKCDHLAPNHYLHEQIENHKSLKEIDEAYQGARDHVNEIMEDEKHTNQIQNQVMHVNIILRNGGISLYMRLDEPFQSFPHWIWIMNSGLGLREWIRNLIYKFTNLIINT